MDEIGIEKEVKEKPCEMYSSLRHLMLLCRWVGFFPVEGLGQPHASHVKFNLKSAYTVFYICSVILLLSELALSVLGCFKPTGMGQKDIMNLALSLAVAINTVLLYKLAKHWPQLLKSAMIIESELLSIRPFSKWHVKCIAVCYTFVVLALVEHSLWFAFNFKLVYSCLGYDRVDRESIGAFFKNHYWQIFDQLPYNIWLGILAEFSCAQSTFLWNFTDILGMCFSIYLISYFQDVAKVINSCGSKDWSKLRACYSRVVGLLNLVNERLAAFILLSSFINLLFICLQLFNSLHQSYVGHKMCEHIPHHIKDVVIAKVYLTYYLFSFIYMVSRALTFAYLASSVHTAAYDGLITLYEVPPSEYNREVQCFQMQLRYTKVALSGIFFFVERKMILRAIGTIITYELVLLQFSYQENTAELGHYNYSYIANFNHL